MTFSSSSLILNFNIGGIEMDGWMDRRINRQQTGCSLNKENGIEVIILSLSTFDPVKKITVGI